MRAMNIVKPEFELKKRYPFHPRRKGRRKTRPRDFENILESCLVESPEEFEDEYRVLLPEHHHFWDNGYEDIG